LGKVGGVPLDLLLQTSDQETLRRRRANAPAPEATSIRLAARVIGSTSEGPPLLGNAVAVALADALEVAVEVEGDEDVAEEVEEDVAVAVDMAVW